MLEIARFEARRRLRGATALTILVLALIALTVGLFPSISESDVDLDAYLDTLSPELRQSFVGSVTSLSTIDGYLVSQLYVLVWLLILGIYFAYAAASLVSAEVENRSIDLLLVNPISRTRFVVEKFLALLPVNVAVNAVSLLAVYFGIQFVGESVPLADLVALHVLFVLYLAACSALGLVASVVFDDVRRAQGVAIGLLFATYFLDSLTRGTDYEWAGQFSFARYLDPADVLSLGEIDWLGAAVLLAVTLGLVMLAAELFEDKDING
ncbi:MULTISPECIES: ABC transporter permease [unclassified Haladaptatus]|uniref:ABC transporter permease n=1 Tax=unclassified Haladaptatus TaxID=2622732 RepID=UPI0023E7C64D|nr:MULTISPECIES: ABC transporter permease subunit [unclassified Haladaptatus]